MEKITDKIRKLLAVARDEGATESEAATAMAFATKLMLEHGISEEAVADTPEKVRQGLWSDTDGDKWVWYCIHSACVLYGTKPIKRGATVAFIGRAANIEATEMTWKWLRDQVESLYKAALPSGMSKAARAQWRTNFKKACAARVYSRACEIVKNLIDRGTEKSTALVVLGYRKQLEAEAEDFLEGMNLKMGRSRKLTIHGHGAVAGLAAGNQVQFQEEIK